jgi:Abnormal spindle-like microcephaly-assoc'd, ASPM-SPD-2-Hydin
MKRYVVAAGLVVLFGLASTAGATKSGLSATPNHVNFGSQAVDGGQTAGAVVTVTNTSSSDALGGVAANTTSPGDFIVQAGASSCGHAVDLPAGQSCTLVVVFDPTIAGRRTATLVIGSEVGSVSVQLSGRGT